METSEMAIALSFPFVVGMGYFVIQDTFSSKPSKILPKNRLVDVSEAVAVNYISINDDSDAIELTSQMESSEKILTVHQYVTSSNCSGEMTSRGQSATSLDSNLYSNSYVAKTEVPLDELNSSDCLGVTFTLTTSNSIEGRFACYGSQNGMYVPTDLAKCWTVVDPRGSYLGD